MKSGNFLCFFCLLFSPLLSADSGKIKLQYIESQVKHFVEKKLSEKLKNTPVNSLEVNIRPIDPHLQLAQCDKELTLSPTDLSLQRNLSIKVRCSGSRPWSIYVGTKVILEQPVVVINNSLPKRHILTAKDLNLESQDIFKLRGGYATDTGKIIGLELKRPVRTGAIVYNHLLKEPNIISKGDRVLVVAQRGALKVSSPGIALNSGSRGDKIRIENLRSSKVIQAKITGPGQAELL